MQSIVNELESFDKALEEAEQIEAMHKSAFRKAFDFLNRQYPPRWDEAYWTNAIKDFTDTICSEPDNALLGELMLGVYEYLDKYLKEHRVVSDG